ncbi:MAG: hypothetical protein ACKVX9_16250 [Blastocatellia bacterium]
MKQERARWKCLGFRLRWHKLSGLCRFFQGDQMNKSLKLQRLLIQFGIAAAFAGMAIAQEPPLRFAGTTCTSAPYLHCPDSECSGATVVNQGNVVEMKTRRTYFLDYPCDMKKGEKVTLILSLHGGGSYGNWQRHYFPIMDYKDKHRLVIATPNAPTRAWSGADDEYLQNIVNSVIEQLGPENIKAFWLVGHSQGGMTSNRLIRTDFFKGKMFGVPSSGGRLFSSNCPSDGETPNIFLLSVRRSATRIILPGKKVGIFPH